MEELMNDYLRHLELVRNYSPSTIRGYRGDLSEALAIFRSLAAVSDMSLALLTPKCLRDYLQEISRRDISSSSICRKISAIRSFCRWLERQQRLDENPAVGLRGPRCTRPLPRYMSFDEVNKLLSSPDTTRGFGCRDLSILHTCYSGGIRVSYTNPLILSDSPSPTRGEGEKTGQHQRVRVSELTSLNVADLNLEEGLLTVRLGKGKRDRFAVIGPPAIQAASQWLTFRARMASSVAVDASALYLNCHGQRLTTRSVSRIFRTYAYGAKLTTHYTLHGIRHTFASHLLQNGASLPEIKELLGHQSLASTCIYSHVAPPQLRRVLEDKHPRA